MIMINILNYRHEISLDTLIKLLLIKQLTCVKNISITCNEK